MDMGHDMGSSAGPACKISMLWNWYTVDSCFLSATWHVRSKGGFAGSVIGVFLLVVAIEAVRRLGREYDRRLTKDAMDTGLRARLASTSRGSSNGDVNKNVTVVEACAPPLKSFTPSWPQQVVRSIVYGSQFTAAFLVMLLGMYYNGYILFAIFIGQTVGYFLFGRDTCIVAGHGVDSGNCC